MRFDRMPFEKVIRQLERIYDEEHAFENPEMASVRLTVYTEQIARDDVMEAIAAALDFSYTRDGERVVWRADRSEERRVGEEGRCGGGAGGGREGGGEGVR